MPAANVPKGKKGGLAGLRLFGQPAWVVVAGVVLAVGVGLYLRKHLSSASGSVSPSASSPASDTSGGAGSAAATPADLTPFQSLADSINGLSGILGAGGVTSLDGSGSVFTPVTAAPVASATTSPYLNSFNPGSIYVDPYGNTVALQPSGLYQPAYIGPGGGYVSPLTYAGAGVAPDPIQTNFAAPAPQQIPAAPVLKATIVSPPKTAAAAPAKKSSYTGQTSAAVTNAKNVGKNRIG